ncbi:hypothetical protein [Nocardia sp. NPDC127526]|uniref:hypothetical protein n=1 Tax=Nocardia sp. NPDC127526 TaxID=3345393 RepID=UPI0036443E1B
MTTISHVRGCLPSTMVSFGTALTTGTSEFTKQVGNMGSAVDKTSLGWKGSASVAATASAISRKVTATRIDEIVTQVADYYKTYGARLDGTRTALLTIVDNTAPAAGMKVADDGTVTAPTYPKTEGNTMLAFIMQARLDSQASWLQGRLRELLKDFGDGEQQSATFIKKGVDALQTLKDKPTAPMIDLPPIPPPKSPDGRYTIGDPKRPFLPHDDTFLYDSKDAGFKDWLKKMEWQGKMLGGEYVRSDLDDATALYRHYWENNGKTQEFDYDEAYREDGAIRRSVDSEISRAAIAADHFARTGNRNFQMTGDKTTIGKNNNYPETENWQKAIGGYQQWSHANVRVEGNRVTMDITVEADDYYNFDKGKNDKGTGTPDEVNGRFTEVGWAKPFESHGSVTRTVSWEVGQPPASGSTDAASTPDRNVGREDRSDGRDDGDDARKPDNDRGTGTARPK